MLLFWQKQNTHKKKTKKKKNKKKKKQQQQRNPLDFKYYLGKLNIQILSHAVQY